MGEEELGLSTQVTIDLVCLKDNYISADMYVLLHWKHSGNYELPEPISELIFDDNQVLEYLEDKGFIKITGDKEFELRNKGLKLFKTTSLSEKFYEFLGKYPFKVPNGKGGNRILRIANPDAEGNKKIKKKYLSIIRNKPSLHEKIIKALELEVDARKAAGDLAYMQKIETWLNQHTYEKYLYSIEEEGELNNEKSDYGQKIV